MTPGDALLLAAAGFGAGTINGAAGGGSLVSFPALLALGYGSIAANVTSTVGIVSGYLGSTAGFRRELDGQRSRVHALLPVSIAGSGVGGVTLLLTPDRAFTDAVPWLILAACALFAGQPVLARRVAARRTARPDRAGQDDGVGWGVQAGVFVGAIYGAYFGAGLGVILLAVLAIGIDDQLLRLNGLRNLLSLVINLGAVVLFALVAPVAWGAAGILAVGALGGGWIGARGARRLPPAALRALVITFGLVAAGRLLLT